MVQTYSFTDPLNGQHNTGRSTLPINASSSQPYQSWKKKGLEPSGQTGHHIQTLIAIAGTGVICHTNDYSRYKIPNTRQPAGIILWPAYSLAPTKSRGFFLVFYFPKFKIIGAMLLFLFFSTIWLLQLMHFQPHTNVQINWRHIKCHIINRLLKLR